MLSNSSPMFTFRLMPRWFSRSTSLRQDATTMFHCKRELHAFFVRKGMIAWEGKVQISWDPKGNHSNVRIIVFYNGLNLKTGSRERTSKRQSQFRINDGFPFVNAVNNTTFSNLQWDKRHTANGRISNFHFVPFSSDSLNVSEGDL